MILAAIEGQLVFLVIAAVIGVINWLGKKKESAADEMPSRQSPSAGRQVKDSEEERVRRFMEALGVPIDQRPPAPVQRRPTPASAPPLPNIQPKGSMVARDPLSTWNKPRPATQQTQKPALPPTLPVTAAPTSVAQVHLPELEVPVVHGFTTVASQVSAIPTETAHGEARDAYELGAETPRAAAGQEVRQLLGSKRDLRAAILLREVLGTPRGLQSHEMAHSFL